MRFGCHCEAGFEYSLNRPRRPPAGLTSRLEPHRRSGKKINRIAGHYRQKMPPFLGTLRNSSGSLGVLILAIQNGPRIHIGAIAVRMIENAKTVEFMEVSEITDHELT